MLLAVALATVAAAAALPTNDPQSLSKLRMIAQCAVKGDSQRVVRLLRSNYNQVNEREDLRDQARDQSRCLGEGRLRFTPLVYRGALAEMMLSARPADLGAAVKADGLPLKAFGALDVMALCAVREDPAGVGALFATQPGSAGENQAIAALSPALGGCLKSGVQANVNAVAIRSLLAVAAWRIADRAAHPKSY
ncbi:hypothetical protein [Sphingomonas ginkgonis]|nr:hypothetical protein [Sphingomonas ginkgonis]